MLLAPPPAAPAAPAIVLAPVLAKELADHGGETAGGDSGDGDEAALLLLCGLGVEGGDGDDDWRSRGQAPLQETDIWRGTAGGAGAAT
jgi:hypothetical protein